MKKISALVIGLSLSYVPLLHAASPNSESGLAYFSDASFWFEIPSSWQPDHDQGRKMGVPLVLYPKGTSWDSARSVMYINSMNKQKHGKTRTLQDCIDDDAVQFKAESPAFKVISSVPLVTKDKKHAIIKQMETGRPQQPYETIAYVDEANTVSLLVLSSKSKDALRQDFPTFRKMVESYSFFTGKINVQSR